MTGSALDEAKVKFEAAAEKILTGITPDMTEYEKELYLHDAIAGIASYAEGDNAHNAYGALVDGIAVCEGYAEALQYLLHRVGIRSFIIIGDAGGPHAWNMVRIDGKYYHVDLTWDDQDENTYYAYFNITDRQLQQDHTIGATAYTLPACTATDAFYYNGKDTYLDNYTVDQVAKLLRDYDLNVQLYISDGAGEFWNWFVTNKNQILPLVGVRDSCSSGCSMMGNEIILSFSGLGVKLTDGDSVSFYATAEKALRYASNDSKLKLLSAVSENVSSELRLSLDLNGYDINGSLTGNNITVFDSQTDDYTINNSNGYGVITGIVTGVATAEGYLPITDENGTSYHRFNVSLDKLVLKAEQTGLYYTGSFRYDEVVAQNMSACGVILSTQNKMPVADDSDPGSRYTVSGNSVLVKNILSQSNAISDNNKNAIKPVHGRAYLKLKDGRIFYSTTKTSNLKTMVEAVDAGAWDKLSQPQKNALLQMYQSYADTMNNWNISNLKSA